ncbi:MAG TPA: hypothetical protein VD860_00850 [Azospirillum sp.]|nr:hypothetical protein [Azospirillum sp.]
MIDRRILFQTAHSIARRECGMYGLSMTYRQAFAIALSKPYAQAREQTERAARAEAFRAVLAQQAREAAARRLAELKGIAADLEHADRLGNADLRRLAAVNSEIHRLEHAA